MQSNVPFCVYWQRQYAFYSVELVFTSCLQAEKDSSIILAGPLQQPFTGTSAQNSTRSASVLDCNAALGIR